jgi:hypothetical protein
LLVLKKVRRRRRRKRRRRRGMPVASEGERNKRKEKA